MLLCNLCFALFFFAKKSLIWFWRWLIKLWRTFPQCPTFFAKRNQIFNQKFPIKLLRIFLSTFCVLCMAQISTQPKFSSMTLANFQVVSDLPWVFLLLGAARYVYHLLIRHCPYFVFGSVLLLLWTHFSFCSCDSVTVAIFQFLFLSRMASHPPFSFSCTYWSALPFCTPLELPTATNKVFWFALERFLYIISRSVAIQSF